LNAIQFNAIAVVFILGFMPFAVAFITNAGSSSDGEYEDSISSAYLAQNFPSQYPGVAAHAGKWINNGGLNHTAHYLNLDSTPHYANRTFVQDGACPAAIQPSTAFPKYADGDCLVSQDLIPSIGVLPMTSKYFPQTHWMADFVGLNYVGSSGNGPFTFLLTSAFFNEIPSNETIDKLKFDLVYTPVDYNCNSNIFQNVSFSADITFHTPTISRGFNDFTFSQNTKYELEQYDDVHGGNVCNVGLVLEFDFRGFESLVIDDIVDGDWYNTTIELNLDDFKRQDDNLPFTTEALPFAGVNSFSIGVQHQSTDPVEAGFIIKTGTLFLAFATFAFAIASTPYWDPFKNTFKGMID
jgi:hypothetical protein